MPTTRRPSRDRARPERRSARRPATPRQSRAPRIIEIPCAPPRARPRDRPARARRACRPVRAAPRSRARSRPGSAASRRDACASRAPVPAPRSRRRRAGDRADASVGRQERASRRPVPPRRHRGPVILAAAGASVRRQRRGPMRINDPVLECPRSTSRANAASCIAGSPTMRCDACTRPRRMSGSLVKENGRSAARSVVPVLGNAAGRTPRNR